MAEGGAARKARPALALSLQLADASHRDVLKRHRVARWIRAALDAPAEIAVRVVGADEGRALNFGYRRKDAPTNVLTFAYDDDAAELAVDGAVRDAAGCARRAATVRADLVLCAPVVEREAREQGVALDAHYAHLVVHGTLHAQGFDHELDADARRMESRESAVLLALGLPDPYADRAADDGGRRAESAPAHRECADR